MTKNATFQVGTTYEVRSLGDHNCRWTFTVAARTAKTVTLVDDHGARIRRGVRVWNDAETVKPFGTYSLCPVLHADRPVK